MYKHKENNPFLNVPDDQGLFGQALSHVKPRPNDEVDLICHQTLQMPPAECSPLESLSKRIRRVLKEHEKQRQEWLQERSELVKRVAALENAVRRK